MSTQLGGVGGAEEASHEVRYRHQQVDAPPPLYDATAQGNTPAQPLDTAAALDQECCAEYPAGYHSPSRRQPEMVLPEMLPAREFTTVTIPSDARLGEAGAADGSTLENPSRTRCLKEMAVIGVPVSLGHFVVTLQSSISLVYAGNYLGSDELGGIGIALMYFNVTGQSVGIGLSSALDTLCSQEYGRNPKSTEVGRWFIRSVYVVLVLLIPMQVFFMCSGPLLHGVFGPTMAAIAMEWLQASALYWLSTQLCWRLAKYFNALSMSWATMVGSVASTVATPFLNQWLVRYGTTGIAIATGLCSMLQFVIMAVIATRATKIRDTMPSSIKLNLWSPAERAKLLEYFQLGVPAMVSVCVLWWTFESIGVMIGHLGELEASGYAVAYQMLLYGVCSSCGIATAAAARIGNYLGAGMALSAKRIYHLSLVLCLGIGTAATAAALLFHASFFRLFTKDEDVLAMAALIAPYFCAVIFLDTVQYIYQGVYRGVGHPAMAAKVSAATLWFVGLPLSFVLGYPLQLGIKGILEGFVVGLTLLGVLLAVRAAKYDWHGLSRDISSKLEVEKVAIEVEMMENGAVVDAGGPEPIPSEAEVVQRSTLQ